MPRHPRRDGDTVGSPASRRRRFREELHRLCGLRSPDAEPAELGTRSGREVRRALRNDEVPRAAAAADRLGRPRREGQRRSVHRVPHRSHGARDRRRAVSRGDRRPFERPDVHAHDRPGGGLGPRARLLAREPGEGTAPEDPRRPARCSRPARGHRRGRPRPLRRDPAARRDDRGAARGRVRPRPDRAPGRRLERAGAEAAGRTGTVARGNLARPLADPGRAARDLTGPHAAEPCSGHADQEAGTGRGARLQGAGEDAVPDGSFIFPALFIAILGPALIELHRYL